MWLKGRLVTGEDVELLEALQKPTERYEAAALAKTLSRHGWDVLRQLTRLEMLGLVKRRKYGRRLIWELTQTGATGLRLMNPHPGRRA